MFRFAISTLISVLMIAGLVFQANAAPIEPRQVGNLGCNIARLRIVSSLAATNAAVNDIQDTATADAASAGVSDAAAGIRSIAQALVTGQTAPADARDQVAAGLAAAKAALDAGDAEDSAVSEAQSDLDKAIAAGRDVVAKCI